MKITRSENWGRLQYDTEKHSFNYFQNKNVEAVPYSTKPVVLNVDLTMKCNMDCRYCVAMDFKEEAKDLIISKELIQWINKSDFMVVVITGGEPLLLEYENSLIILLSKIKRKGLIVDTNGTIFPSKDVIKALIKANALLRISLDSPRPQDEIYFRHALTPSPKNMRKNLELYKRKLSIIERLRSQTSINIALQSVVHSKNADSIFKLPAIIERYSIKKWYIQRFIPSYRAADMKFDDKKYEEKVAKLAKLCKRSGIECVAKLDRRHNSVFLLVGNGLLYTQGMKPRQKVLLGSIKKSIKYFTYVSMSDHCERYY